MNTSVSTRIHTAIENRTMGLAARTIAD